MKRSLKPLRFATKKSWRQWLEKHHATKDETMLVIFKRGPKNASFSNRDAVEEALCFGWIDGWFKPIDTDRWVIRYTPRRKGSNWSDYNIARAWTLLNNGRMTPAGIERLPPDVFQVWKKHRPAPTIIDSRGARKGQITFANGKNYLSSVKRPALAP